MILEQIGLLLKKVEQVFSNFIMKTVTDLPVVQAKGASINQRKFSLQNMAIPNLAMI